MRIRDKFLFLLSFLFAVSLGMDLQANDAAGVFWDVLLGFLTFTSAVR